MCTRASASSRLTAPCPVTMQFGEASSLGSTFPYETKQALTTGARPARHGGEGGVYAGGVSRPGRGCCAETGVLRARGAPRRSHSGTARLPLPSPLRVAGSAASLPAGRAPILLRHRAARSLAGSSVSSRALPLGQRQPRRAGGGGQREAAGRERRLWARARPERPPLPSMLGAGGLCPWLAGRPRAPKEEEAGVALAALAGPAR